MTNSIPTPRHRAAAFLILAGLLTAVYSPAQNRRAFEVKSFAPPAPNDQWDRGVKRVRAVETGAEMFSRASAKRFRAARRMNLPALPGNDASRVEMNFFDDVSLTVRWTGVEQTPDWKGEVWSGVVEGSSQGHAVLVSSEGMMTGNFTRGDGTLYQLRPGPDGTHWVREVDQSRFGGELPPRSPAASEAVPPPQASSNSADDGGTVDVMVLYTQAARQKAGGTQAMEQLVALGIAETNQGYASSGVVHRVRLVHTGEVNYQETTTDMGVDLDRIADPSDGHLDELHRMRDTYNADLVSLWVEGGDACGIAFLLKDPSVPLPQRGFSVVGRECATGYYSFAHEMGHNMGATHGRDDNTGEGAFPYSHAFKQYTGDKFRTIMGYNNNCSCPRVNFWSNPSVMVKGVAAGVNPNSANGTANFLTLNNTRTVVANYRTSVPAGGGTPPSGGGLPESSHPYLDGIDLIWTYTHGSSASSLNVTFDARTSVESGYDFIYIYDRNNTQISGSPFTGSALSGRTVTVPGSVAKIRLTSDGDIADYGFRVASITGNGVGGGGTLPRLAVTTFSIPTTGAAGQRLTGMRTTVANQGGAAAGSFRLGFYFSRNRAVTAADIFSGWYCTYETGLAANASSTCNGEIGIPTTVAPGTWYVAAIADDLNQVQQSDRSGNIRVADAAVTITGGTAAEITSPAPGSVFTSNTVTFRWTAGTGVSGYTLAIGTTAGGTNVYNRDQGANLSATVSGLPVNGAALFVTLTSRIGTENRSNTYNYSAASLGTGGNLAHFNITAFTISTTGAPGGSLSDMSLAFMNDGSGPTGPFRVGFYLSRNATVTTSDVFTGWSCGYPEGLSAGQNATCTGGVGLPTTASPGTWNIAAIADDQNKVQQSDRSGSVHLNDNGPITISGVGAADMISPTPGSTLTGSTVAFRWNAGSGAEQYVLYIGSAVGGDDILAKDLGTGLNVTVQNLPVNGRTIYVRLWSRFGGDWYSNDYTYRAFNAPAGGVAPKLVVTTFVAPIGGIIGTNLQGTSTTVSNQGNANAGPFRIGFYYSRNRIVTVNDTFSGWSCTASQGLAAGASFTCNGEIGVPTTLTAGVWYLASIADDRAQVQQADRSGNSRSSDNGSITLTAASGGTGGTLPESRHPYADNLDQSWTYTAAGNPAAIRVTFDARTSVEEDYDFIYVYDSAGRQIPGSPFTGTALADKSVVVPGAQVRVRLVSDESLNDWGFRVTGVTAAGALPRLVVTTFTTPTRGVAGGVVQNTRMTVTNQGNAAAGAFTVGYYLSRTQNVTVNDVYTGWFCDAKNGLAAGASTTCTGDLGIPKDLGSGAWYLAAIADDKFKVDQADRSGATRLNENGVVTIGVAPDEGPQSSAAEGVNAEWETRNVISIRQ